MSGKTARQIARVILQGFGDYRTQFTDITLGARDRFLNADWSGAQEAASDRINLYSRAIRDVMELLDAHTGGHFREREHWAEARMVYIDLISYRTDPELAETFYNSVYRKLFHHHLACNSECFINSEFEGFSVHSPRGIYRSYQFHGNPVALVGRMMADFAFELPWANQRRDVRNIIVTLKDALPEASPDTCMRVDILKWVFYRNKGAYLVGRVISKESIQPFVLPVLNNERGSLYVDTILYDNDDVSILFSFTRAYFMVDARNPSECIEFLHTLLPEKPRWEIYSSIGFYKHGKTVFHRDFLEHMAYSSDKFEVAPGVRGMVMAVFTLPSLDYVFKIIKDHFSPPKDITKERVKDRYYLVKTHDRVGRMADTQEFSNLALPRERFSKDLLDELLSVAPSAIEVSDDTVLIHHLYCERRMIPLNLYVSSASEKALYDVLDEYGNAIKQLAAANIFPGDMLLKNFGVTRHGRVVFYDYDEISYLTECCFRDIPEPLYPEQELAAEPWYSVGENDIFPEEFPVFLFPDARIRQQFRQLHGDLFTARYWQGVQDEILKGKVMNVFPYRRSRRFMTATA
ncbi:bifunctional isocitrate dehydrogenase kinase/phosphatase [Candidatus Sororendozoicomonas aggregata]|uniref:bifunctional isocitrate dehydrogenase kinase/phosphatase n=1 Tax=Candidatus Sororendozoicomonas aggregata TaxID=3073239 RepID=UPI002ED3FF5A